jgi:hypothetical protein
MNFRHSCWHEWHEQGLVLKRMGQCEGYLHDSMFNLFYILTKVKFSNLSIPFLVKVYLQYF